MVIVLANGGLDSSIPSWKGTIWAYHDQITNQRAPNQQWTISWGNLYKNKHGLDIVSQLWGVSVSGGFIGHFWRCSPFEGQDLLIHDFLVLDPGKKQEFTRDSLLLLQRFTKQQEWLGRIINWIAVVHMVSYGILLIFVQLDSLQREWG